MKGKDNARNAAAAWCAAEVRRHDPDRYFAALFAPPAARARLLALYAFAHEVAKVREMVSEPLMGEIRLQWWRETLEGFVGGDVRRHPAAEALHDAIMQCGLPLPALQALIDARSADLSGDEVPFADEAALLAYADATASALMALARQAETCRPLSDREEAAARAGGRAWAVTGLLRALPWRAQDRRIIIPRSILQARSVSPESVFAGRFSPELGHALADMAALAREQLREARKSGAARGPAFLYLSLCSPYLGQITRPGFDPFRTPVQLGALRRLTRMWASAVQGQV